MVYQVLPNLTAFIRDVITHLCMKKFCRLDFLSGQEHLWKSGPVGNTSLLLASCKGGIWSPVATPPVKELFCRHFSSYMYSLTAPKEPLQGITKWSGAIKIILSIEGKHSSAVDLGREWTVADFQGTSLYLVRVIVTNDFCVRLHSWDMAASIQTISVKMRNPGEFSDHKAGHPPWSHQCHLRRDLKKSM